MKTLIIALIASLATFSSAADIYANAYRFADENHTGVIGVSGERFGAEYSFADGELALTNRLYLEFTNVEIGVKSELTTKAQDNAKDWRVIDIEGGLQLIAKPYLKVGSVWFAVFELDETNSTVLSVGFNLY